MFLDVVQQCLSLAPVPYLSPAFSVLAFIYTSVKQVQASKEQLRVLSFSIAQFLQVLDSQYRTGRLIESHTIRPLQDLNSLLEEIKTFVLKHTSHTFLKSLYIKDARISRIDAYHRRLHTLIHTFQVSSLINIQEWQVKNDEARVNDQKLLDDRLTDLETNQTRMLEALDAQQGNVASIMVLLEKCLDQQIGNQRERQFFSKSLQYFSTASGTQVRWERWMITSFEVEFDAEIGSGGFGRVFRGSWNKTEVALKVLKTQGGMSPSSKMIRREVDVWLKLTHPHILQFLGANILDETPFIVMPYLKNGNALDYVQNHPNCNRLKILHHVSLGLIYLHSRKVIHGDLKALNILIDDADKAVLCDFGLTRVKSDVTSRTSQVDTDIVIGSRNWMAPERLMGGIPQKPCDVYAYGMTLYELYTNETPLGHLGFTEFIDLVVDRDVRPEKPEAPHLTDDIWYLAESCWAKDPLMRPTASSLCDSVVSLQEGASVPITFPEKPSLGALSATSFPEYFTSNQKVPDVTEDSPLPKQVFAERAGENKSMPLYPFHAYPTKDKPIIPPIAQSAEIEKGKMKQTIPVTQAQVTTKSMPRWTPLVVPQWDEGTLRWRGHSSEISCVTLSPDGTRLATASTDKTVKLWDASTGESILKPCMGSANKITSMAFFQDGRRLVAGIQYHSIRMQLWDLDTGRIVSNSGAFVGHSMTVDCVVISPDGTLIASGSADKTVRLWSAETYECIREPLEGHTGGVCSVAFSSDGGRLVSGSSDGLIHIWDVETGRSLIGPLGSFHQNCSAIFIANDTQIVAGSVSQRVCKFDAATGKVLFAVHITTMTMCYSMTPSPDGSLVVLRTLSQPPQLWDTANGKLVTKIFKDADRDPISSITFFPDGQSIAAGSSKGLIRIHKLQLEAPARNLPS